MFGLGRKWPRRTAQIAAAGMLAASGSMFFASTALAGNGNNGTVFINNISFDSNGNDPHITCPIKLKWEGFDTSPGGATFTVSFTPHAPTGGTVTATGDLGPTTFFGGSADRSYALSFTGAPQPNGEFHLDVDVETTNSTGGSISKQKTVWVKDCGHDLSIDKSGTATASTGDTVTYKLKVENVGGGPTTGTTTVTDNLPGVGLAPATMDVDAGSAGTWNCPNAAVASATPTCTTNSTLNPGDVATFTVTTTLTAVVGSVTNTGSVSTPGDAVAANNTDTQDTSVKAAGAKDPDLSIDKSGTSAAFVGDPVSYTLDLTVGNGPNDGPTTGTTTVSDTLPTDFTGGSMSYTSGTGSAGATTAANWTCAALSCHTNAGVLLQPGDTVKFTVTATAGGNGTKTDRADVSTPNDSDSTNDRDSFNTVVTVPGDLTLQAACSPAAQGQVLWTITNPAANPTVNSVAVSNGAAPAANTLAAGASTTFTTAAPQNAPLTASAVTTPGNQSLGSNAVSFSGTCTAPPPPANEIPASAVFTSTCDGIHAVFTTASLHVTQFDVTEPDGNKSTVNGSGTQDYAADAVSSHLSVTYDGANQTFDWSDPGGCVQPGQADPEVSAANHCKTGINVTLSNLNGTADTTFTVVDPDGKSHSVDVRAGQMKKVVYEVTEDTTGEVTVSAAGLAKQTFSYDKDCAEVLGVKHTRKPPHKPVVKGEHAQLPFTGFDMKRALLDGAALFFLGAMLCAFAGRREEQPRF
jgi:uncharacterized repeat protein (TIGR01451 family)